MADTTQCPSCKRRLQVPETHLGKSVQCPQCRNTFIAVDPGSLPAAPSRLPTPRADPEPPPPPRRSEFDWSRNDDPYDRPARRVDRRYDDRNRYSVPHRGGLVITLGILSLFICGVGFILGIMAWVMGANDMGEIRAGRMDRTGEGTTQAGMVCGIVGAILQALGVLLFLLGNLH
ncbi:MAG: hypothetical protein K2X38_23495 [Gemmataceae bacterium]|nr:hypothetical protein [Gemmataceae bacterium]